MKRKRSSILSSTRCVMFGVALLGMLAQFPPATARARVQNQSRVMGHAEVKALPSKEKRWALIVGIDEYDKDVSSLKGAVNDARALKDVLVKQAGFPESQVILLTSDAGTRDQLPTRVNILEELDFLSGRVPIDGLLLFSFSGHGVSIGNEAYLIPSDGRITKNLKLLRNFSIDVRWIKEAIEESKVKQVLMLLDACRNEVGKGETENPLTEAYKSGFSFDVVNSGVKAFATLYATSIGYRAFEFFDKDTRRYRGYFSYAVEEGLKGKAANARGEITLSGLTEYVDRIVPERVRLAKREKQEPFKEIAGYKESELVLAIVTARITAIGPIGSAAKETGGTIGAVFFPINVSVGAAGVNAGWNNGGLVIRRGQHLRVTASGRISLGSEIYSTPAGLSNLTDNDKLMRSEPTGALIAVIGDDNDDFIFIGARQDIVAARDGLLFLGVNESKLADNSGLFTARIEAEAVPDVAVNTGIYSEPPKPTMKGDATSTGESGSALQRGYRTGYSDGYPAGLLDSRKQLPRAFWNKEHYLRADRFFNFQWGSLESFRDGYQQGFEAGYEAGYQRSVFISLIPSGLTRRGTVP